jgi:hypothetical protein
VITITEPGPGADLPAGGTVTVSGTARFTGGSARLDLSGVDGLGCTPVSPRWVELMPAPGGGAVPFQFQGVEVGEMGGTLEVSSLRLGVVARAQVSYRSGRLCEGCPAVTFSLPTPSVSLARHELAVRISGRVDGALTTPMVFSVDESGREVRWPLGLSGGTFAGRVVPVSPGDNDVGVEVVSAQGTRRCVRRVAAPGEDAALSVHLSWEGETADLDLVVVPPDRGVGEEDCRPRQEQPWCSFPTRDAVAPGPEAALIPAPGDGSFGVLVLGVPGLEGPVRALCTVMGSGVVLQRVGPTLLDPRAGQVWQAARVNVAGGVVSVEVLDRTLDEPPTGAPDRW